MITDNRAPLLIVVVVENRICRTLLRSWTDDFSHADEIAARTMIRGAHLRYFQWGLSFVSDAAILIPAITASCAGGDGAV